MKYFYLVFFLSMSVVVRSQNVGINSDGTTPDASAILDVKSSNKGLLVPRVSLTGSADYTTVPSPALSLLIYNTATAGSGILAVSPGFYYWNGSGWMRVGSEIAGWTLSGNSGTVAGTHFLGTTDNVPIQFRVNNFLSGYISSESGNDNTFFGYKSGSNNTTGNQNTAVGSASLTSNTTGIENTAIGVSSLKQNIDGFSNTAVGWVALKQNTNGHENIAVGRSSLYNNSAGWGNVAIGRDALFVNTTGYLNTGLGFKADVGGNNFTNATALGSNSYANCSNCIVLGSVNKVNGATTNVNVGIGRIDPAFPLAFADSLGEKISLWGSSNTAHYGIGVQSSLLQIYSGHTIDDIAFGYGGSNSFTETVRIKGNGNMGIGTSTPRGPVDVSKDGDVYLSKNGDVFLTGTPNGGSIRSNFLSGHVYITTYGNSDISYLQARRKNDSASASLRLRTMKSGLVVEAMHLDSSGNIGIGTANPRGALDIAKSGDVYLSKDGDVYLTDSPDGGSSRSNFLPGHIYLAPFGNTDTSYLQARRRSGNGTSRLQFRTMDNGTVVDAMHLSEKGYVGIGSTAPAQPLSFGSSTGGKISLYDVLTGDHFGMGIQPSKLQMYMPNLPGQSIVFGLGHSEAFTQLMQLTWQGDLFVNRNIFYGNSSTQSSDIRLKENLALIEGGLQKYLV